MARTGEGAPHGIRDNHKCGRVSDFLIEKVAPGSALSIVSAYFTIYAYEALAAQLDRIESLRFLFGEPRFIASLDPEKTDKKAFKIEDEGLSLANRLQQKEVARRCAEWLEVRVEVRSIRQANLLHGKPKPKRWQNASSATATRSTRCCSTCGRWKLCASLKRVIEPG